MSRFLTFFLLLTLFTGTKVWINGFTEVSGLAQEPQTEDPEFQIKGKVWFDNDRNGRRDSYDSGLGGVGVDLYSSTRLLLGRAVSAQNGEYAFIAAEGSDTENSRYGVDLNGEETYFLEINLSQSELHGYTPTFVQPGDPTRDSNGELEGQIVTAPVTLTLTNPQEEYLDFGFRSGNFGDSVVRLPAQDPCPIPGLEDVLVGDEECGGFGGAQPEEPEVESEILPPQNPASPIVEEEEVKTKNLPNPTSTQTPALIRTGGVAYLTE